MRRKAVTVGVSIAASVLFAAVLVGKWDELEAGITGAAADDHRPGRCSPGGCAGVAQRGLAGVRARLRRDREPPQALPGVEHRMRGQPAQPRGGDRGADRGPAPLGAGGDPARSRPDRRRASDPLRRGDACRAHLVHPGRPARPPVVDADRVPRRRGLRGPRVQEHRGREGALAGQGPVGAALAARQRPARGVRADRGLRPDSPELAAAPRRRSGRLAFSTRSPSSSRWSRSASSRSG